ncbi:MAG: hypothetical protein RLZZ596_413 [Pseudomonadota bacterium]|jgi:hypothetical protein
MLDHRHRSMTSRSPWRAAWLLWLVLAMLMSQALALAHRSLHLGTGAPSVAQSPDSITLAAAGFWDHLRNGQVSDADCRLYDLNLPGDASVLAGDQAFSLLPPISPLSIALALLATTHFTNFEARGPPLIR